MQEFALSTFPASLLRAHSLLKGLPLQDSFVEAIACSHHMPGAETLDPTVCHKPPPTTLTTRPPEIASLAIDI